MPCTVQEFGGVEMKDLVSASREFTAWCGHSTYVNRSLKYNVVRRKYIRRDTRPDTEGRMLERSPGEGGEGIQLSCEGCLAG